MNIGDRLRKERERLGLNQPEFGAIAGVSKTTQFNYEKGDRSPDAEYLAAIAGAGVDVLYVLTGTRSTPDAESLSPRAAALLNNFENMADEDKRAIERLADAVQKPQTQGLTGTK
ncbi:helix-turn-helix domain-containing protein [Cellvibrio mixtus]|uniref:helix-turn-helix domain-containing protein n=1 Tax=Cellvibrio mixtus TaxID=39650 RepID=UPI0005878DEC|nr:helix-turn-helix transcriptional regulator [Cellvibrio mixtus]